MENQENPNEKIEAYRKLRESITEAVSVDELIFDVIRAIFQAYKIYNGKIRDKNEAFGLLAKLGFVNPAESPIQGEGDLCFGGSYLLHSSARQLYDELESQGFFKDIRNEVRLWR